MSNIGLGHIIYRIPWRQADYEPAYTGLFNSRDIHPLSINRLAGLDLANDVGCEQARQRSRGVSNALLDEMEDAARSSRKQDQMTLGKIDSILQAPWETRKRHSYFRRAGSHPPLGQNKCKEDLDYESWCRARRRRNNNQYIVPPLAAESGDLLPSQTLKAHSPGKRETPLVVIVEHVVPRKPSYYEGGDSEAEPPPAHVARAMDHAKRAAQRYDDRCYGEQHLGHGPRAHSHPPGHAGHHDDQNHPGHHHNDHHHDEKPGHHHHHHHHHHGIARSYGKNPYAVVTPAKPPISEQRKKIERRLDHLLDYEMPTAENFYAMRSKLRDVNEKMLGHKLLIDRYSGVELAPGRSVDESVQAKYHQLAQRMPELERYKQVRPPKTEEEKLYYNSPRTTVGYTGSLMPQGQEVSELRGRIRRLVCRSKANPHYYRM